MVKKLLDNGAIVLDNWSVFGDDIELNSIKEIPQRKFLLSLKHWGEFRPQIVAGDYEKFGIIINTDESPRLVASDLERFACIAINFPVFTDGRAYSHCRELREHFAYEGEVRAIGDVLLDQLYAMKRVGFSSFILRKQEESDKAKRYLSTFTFPYQGAVDDPRPMIHR